MRTNRKFITSILAGSVLAAASGVSTADSTYVGIHGMWTDLKDLDFNVAPGTVESQFDSGTGFGITLGRSFNQFRAVNTSSATDDVSNSIAYKTNNILVGARFMF